MTFVRNIEDKPRGSIRDFVYIRENTLSESFCEHVINRFNHDDIGWNYRMTNLQAAVGCGQLKNISWIIKRKREIGKRYISILSK